MESAFHLGVSAHSNGLFSRLPVRNWHTEIHPNNLTDADFRIRDRGKRDFGNTRCLRGGKTEALLVAIYIGGHDGISVVIAQVLRSRPRLGVFRELFFNFHAHFIGHGDALELARGLHGDWLGRIYIRRPVLYGGYKAVFLFVGLFAAVLVSIRMCGGGGFLVGSLILG